MAKKPALVEPLTTGSKPRIAPKITKISKSVIMPELRRNRRGSKSPYPFDELTEKGQSFGITNKTAKNMASIVSNQNRKAMVQEQDENGNPVFKTNEMKDAEGNITLVPTEKPKMIATKHFFAIDVEPNEDKDKATVRIFRDG
jgi:hypothetical protein